MIFTELVNIISQYKELDRIRCGLLNFDYDLKLKIPNIIYCLKNGKIKLSFLRIIKNYKHNQNSNYLELIPVIRNVKKIFSIEFIYNNGGEKLITFDQANTLPFYKDDIVMWEFIKLHLSKIPLSHNYKTT